VHAFQSADNPSLTGLVIAVNDMDALIAMLGAEEWQRPPKMASRLPR
jgi:hypothetical protein